jgi:glycosyltransferase involved in cell wall biosynthesis
VPFATCGDVSQIAQARHYSSFEKDEKKTPLRVRLRAFFSIWGVSVRIAVFGTQAGGGGASRAMHRLVVALTSRGHHVDLFHLERHVTTPQSILIEPAAPRAYDAPRWETVTLLEQAYLRTRRSPLSDTLFSFPLYGYDPRGINFLLSYDIINIHWVAFFLSIEGIGQIISTGRPVVFTLHDMAHFTGGCHYSAGCKRYITGCVDCPQLNPDVLSLTADVQRVKRRLFKRPNVAVTAPSRWLAHCSDESGVLGTRPARYISNPIETNIFYPQDPLAARQALGLDPADKVILFGALDAGERRKGFRHLLACLDVLAKDPRIAALFDAGRLKILTFGNAPGELKRMVSAIQSLGYIDNDVRLAQIYNAADVLILPSLEDNQPNVMIEAMACGTPVVAFAVGGIADMVIEGVTGFLVQDFDVGAMAGAISKILCEPGIAPALRRNASAKISSECNLDTVGGQFEALCCELIEGSACATEIERGSNLLSANDVRPRSIQLQNEFSPLLDGLASRGQLRIPNPKTEQTAEQIVAEFRASLTKLVDLLRTKSSGRLALIFRLPENTSAKVGEVKMLRLARLILVITALSYFSWNFRTLGAVIRSAPRYILHFVRWVVQRQSTSN